MNPATIQLYPHGPMLALVGNPNCGKTALFNQLTGSRQKVANYAGVTVERKEGRLKTPSGKTLRVLDLPGAYSLYPRSPDERVTCDVLFGTAKGERRPDIVVCVMDATNLRRNLHLTLAVKRLGLPCCVALNMADMAEKRGTPVDPACLSKELGLPVVCTVAIQRKGAEALLHLIDDLDFSAFPPPDHRSDNSFDDPGDHRRVQAILEKLGLDEVVPHLASERLDRTLLHPVSGPLILGALLFFMFQAVFSWAQIPMALIEQTVSVLRESVQAILPDIWFRSLLADGIIAGVGGVLVFLPQILILFFFILVLEESGYLPRAAFLLDRIMGSIGLSGRSFIPLLSSFACAIPGIMAARTIANTRDRIVTILVAPLMTCSARLPVYALLIGAFIPVRPVFGVLQLQGLVLFMLYLSGIAAAMTVAWLLKRFTAVGRQVRPLMMELPVYHWPMPGSIAIGLWQRAVVFVKRVGTIIVALSMALWFLASFPQPTDGGAVRIEHSYAGHIGQAMSALFEPIGFNWQISIALIPGLAAREAAVGALGTVYSLADDSDEDKSETLAPLIAADWSPATAFSLLAWFVFAPQCLATFAAVRRETGGWSIPAVMAAYLFGLAYLMAFLTYRLATALGYG